jgi:hypothetical protein
MVTIITSTYHASRKTVEDAEIFQVLEESTDSDVTIFSSEEDEDGNGIGRKRSLPIGTAFPNIYHTLQKISGRVKVCACV